MSKYTVIGVFDDTGEVVHTFNEARDATQAMVNVSKIFDLNTELQIIGAIEGEHCMTKPGDDNLRSSYASDMGLI